MDTLEDQSSLHGNKLSRRPSLCILIWKFLLCKQRNILQKTSTFMNYYVDIS